MKAWLISISALLSCILILLWRLPATWFVQSINIILAPTALLTQIQGTLWNGDAYFNAPSLQVETPIHWKAQWSMQSGVQWDITVYDHKQLSIQIDTQAISFQLDPLEIPASLVLSGQKNKGKVTGYLIVSGLFNLATQAGQGTLSYRNITLEDGVQSVRLGTGGASWSCTRMIDCVVHFEPGTPLQLAGQLEFKQGMINGHGTLKPNDAILIYAIQTAPPTLFEPVKLSPFNAPITTPTIPATSKITTTTIPSPTTSPAWEWALPSFPLHLSNTSTSSGRVS